MSRVVQPVGTKGSLKWIQRAVANRPDILQPTEIGAVRWVSPLSNDDFAEYRDGSFLSVLGLEHYASDLKSFWPRGGPQWDALGKTDTGVVLAEAKAHANELVSPPTEAKAVSRALIERSFGRVKRALGVEPERDWTRNYYQLANRIAHLWFLRNLGVDAHLILVDFLGDSAMNGPSDPGEWGAAYDRAHALLGLPNEHPLSANIHHVFPQVGLLVQEV